MGFILPFSIALALSLVPTLAWAEDPAILTRDQWGAKPPVKAMPIQTPARITIHHTGHLANWKKTLKEKLQSLQAFSQTDSRLDDGRPKAAWGDIPYHFYIDVGGAVGEGRKVNFVGDTNTDYDPTGHIGIVIEGDFDREKPTAAQIQSLERLLLMLTEQYHIDVGKIGTHQQFAHTACPGKNLMAVLPAILARLKSEMRQEE
jgi:hypothetical protein